MDEDAAVGPAVLLQHDDLLRDVDEAAREVAGVGGAERGVGKALARAVGGDEVLQHAQPLAEAGPDGQLDDRAAGAAHESAPRGHLLDLGLVAPRAGVGHGVDAAELGQVLLDGLVHLAGGVLPHVDDARVAFVLGDEAHLVLLLQRLDLFVRPVEDGGLALRHLDVRDGDGGAGGRGVVEADLLDPVQHLGGGLVAREPVHVPDEVAEGFLVHQHVVAAQFLRQDLVEDDAARGRLDPRVSFAGSAHGDDGVQFEYPRVERDEHVVEVAVAPAFALRARLRLREVVAAEDDLVRGGDERLAGAGREHVVRAQHHVAGFLHRLAGEGDVHGHLVAVEVGVERGADERVQLDGAALDERWHERLDAEPVQRRRAVQHDGAGLDDLFEDVPDLGACALHHALGALDVVRHALHDEPVHHERLEEFQRHLLRQAAFVETEGRPDDDDGASAVVDALAEEVLAEASLLAAQQVGQALELVVVAADDGAAPPPVVDEVVHGLLEHALLVADDDRGRAEVQQPLEAVVPVDDPAVEVVQVARGEAPAVQLHHGAQVGREHGERGHDHPLRLVAAAVERLDDLDALDGLLPALTGRGADLVLEGLHLLLQVERPQDVEDGLGAHASLEDVAVLVGEFAVAALREQHQRLEAPHLGGLLEEVTVELLQPLVARFPQRGQLRGKRLPPGDGVLPDGVRHGLHLSLQRGDALVHLLFFFLALLAVFEFQLLEAPRLQQQVHPRNDVLREVEHALEVAGRHVQQQAEPAGDALGEPDVGDGRGEGDVPHALAAHLGAGNLDAAAVAYHAAVADLLVLAAVALPVLGGPEDALAEQAVLLGAERAVVDGLRLEHLAVRPLLDLLRRGE